jgi:hypothetical protein
LTAGEQLLCAHRLALSCVRGAWLFELEGREWLLELLL